MRNVKSKLGRAMLLGMIVAFAACHADNEIAPLDSIPASATLIAQADLDALLKMAGCQSRYGSLQFTPELEKVLAHALGEADMTVIRRTAEAGDCADLRDAYIFTLPGIDGLITLSTLKDRAQWHDLHTDGVSMTVKGSQLWVSRTPISPDSIVAIAADSPAAASSIIARALSAQGVIKGRVLSSAMTENPLGDNFDAVTFAFSASDRSISASCMAAANDTAVNPFSLLEQIDHDRLATMPTIPALCIAAGLTHGAIDAVTEMLKPARLTHKIALKMLLACLSPAGGTFTLQAAPGGNAETIRDISPDNWIVKAELPMDGDDSHAMLALLASQIPGFEAESSDTTLSLSNYDTDDDTVEYSYQWDFVPAECQAAVAASIPYQSELMKAAGLHNGYMARIGAADSTLNASLKISGDARYIIPALISELAAKR